MSEEYGRRRHRAEKSGGPIVAFILAVALLGGCSGNPTSPTTSVTTIATTTSAVPTTAADAADTANTDTADTANTDTADTDTADTADTADSTDPSGGADPASVPARPSAGCEVAPDAIPPGERRVTITSSGVERWFFERVPPAHDGRQPLPLVVDFHGYSEGADIHLLMSALGPFGDEHGFVTITPQGTGPVPAWDTTLGGADLEFVADVLDHAEATLCIDTNRVFVTGLSNGAFMSSAIACAYPDRVAAIAPVAGIRDVPDCPAARRPVPVVAFHGTADGFVAYDGGLGEQALDLPAPDGSGRTLREAGVERSPDAKPPLSVPDIALWWAARNGCDGPELESAVSADVDLLTYGCPAGADVELYRIDGGGHSWPGSDFSAQVAAIIGPTTFSIDANEVMWAFFMAHPLTTS